MIEFGKITGEINKDLMEVQLRTGECVWGVLMNVGTSTSLPTKLWLSSNKDNFLALVSFEKDILVTPIIVGFYPVKGAKTQDFDLVFKLMKLFEDLLDELKNAKTNTMMGPQTFFPDTLLKITQTKLDLEKLKQERLELNK